MIRRHETSLTERETGAIRERLRQDAPTLLPIAETGMMPFLVEQPFFGHHRIVQVDLPAVFPPKHLHFALGPGGAATLLTAHIERIAFLVADDPPPRVAGERDAVEYGNAIDEWTTESPLGELVITAFDEIPFYENLDIAEQAWLEPLQEAVSPHVAAPYVEVAPHGFIVVKWLVESQRLVRRFLHVQLDGRITRSDEVVAEDLPCPPGKYWGMRDGRLVPVG